MFIKILFVAFITIGTAHAGWFDSLFGKAEEAKQKVVEVKQIAEQHVVDLSNTDIATGLKQALDKGVDHAVSTLGKQDGFLKNAAVAIPMPDNLKKVDKALRKIGQDRYADQFVTTLNRAAEAATPLTADILKAGVSNMTFADAKEILNGPDDAATRYLQRLGGPQISDKIRPIVSNATSEAGVTRNYKKMLSKLEFMGSYVQAGDYDIDRYVTEKTVDGLFKQIAVQEKLIRQDPAARTTEILQDVFGRE